jgi:hypothetical protein
MNLPSDGWLQFCTGCGIITSGFIPKKHYKITKSLDNSDIVYICFQCQKNKNIVTDIFKNIK